MKSESQIKSAVEQTKAGVRSRILAGDLSPERYAAFCMYHNFLERFGDWLDDGDDEEGEDYANGE
jgi:hypothetical protein